ncbi:hypothetical protein G112A_00471 [Candidatus Nanosynsacchari sp. TM7_G1_3_12Alb]|nr:hypothetical protein G112A_00471 [Candidatus Nanosynsacchari sp. TM7_G1_3_12Alb]
MRHKWISVSAAGGVFQHRHIHLGKAVTVQIITRRLPKLTASNKPLTYLWIDIHIDIAATETLFFVL